MLLQPLRIEAGSISRRAAHENQQHPSASHYILEVTPVLAVQLAGENDVAQVRHPPLLVSPTWEPPFCCALSEPTVAEQLHILGHKEASSLRDP